MIDSKVITLAGAGLIAICGFGCGGAPAPKLPDPVSVTGKVIIDNKPLADAIVTFFPDGVSTKGNGATALTDADGEFELVTAFGKTVKSGAIPGKYRVAISRLVDPKGEPVVLQPGEAPANFAARESLPMRYSDMNKTQLKADVNEDGGTFEFKVTAR